MLFELPDHDTLYQALIKRDTRYEGVAFVGVTTTGIFCRLTCAARKPHSVNCTFYESPTACVQAGFRPCKRCLPLGHEAAQEPAIDTLLAALKAEPARRFKERDIQTMGFDPSTVRRLFKRYFGMTFLELARHTRLREGFDTLSTGGSVTDAQLSAGFESSSAFRAAFTRLLGHAPSDLSGSALRADWLDSPLGPMIAVCDRQALHLLEFVDRKALPTELGKLSKKVKGQLGIGRFALTDEVERQLGHYFDKRSAEFSVRLAYHGSAFTRSVWDALRAIPAGETRSYGQLAAGIGNPNAVRAVARANGANQISLLIPCHRVIGADGSLTGYGGGLWRKQKLIELERHYAHERA
ncbi:MAG: trifunctional transcriptional activator/DNA repair protein Ada/methylated-DNA--[protein]-cysteine S-methyltransferase [Pseudomonadota bacterium]